MSPFIPFGLGWLLGRSQGGFSLFGSSNTSEPMRGLPMRGGGGLPAHHAHPAPIVHDQPHAIPMATSTAVHWTSNAPAGLPPFPSGWKPAATTPAVVSRAWALMGTIPVGETKYEKSGDGWIAFHASTEGGKKFVTAWEPKGAVMPAAVPLGIPVVSPVVMQHPVVSPAPPGGHPTISRNSKGDAVREWQRRLGIKDDGDFGPTTERVTRAWQLHHGLKDDGVVGPLSWAASETTAA